MVLEKSFKEAGYKNLVITRKVHKQVAVFAAEQEKSILEVAEELLLAGLAAKKLPQPESPCQTSSSAAL